MPVADDNALLETAYQALAPHQPERIAVAVSGGSDSMASLHLLWRLAQQHGWHLRAVTVDHALRPEAAHEAQAVADVCRRLGVPHDTLVWDHGAIAGNLMDAARRARYAMMADWAAAHSVAQIVLGHTADDQAETFLMGLARGAGLDGLTGMRRFWDQGGIRFLRPFLHIQRNDLRAYLSRQGLTWTDDPSNANDRFDRVKARKALKTLKPLGVTAARMAGTMQNLQLAQAALQQAVAHAAAQVCTETAGELVFDRDEWHRVTPEIQRRLLIAGFLWVSGAEYAPRSNAIARVLTTIADGREATLGGCRLRQGATGFRIMREAKAVEGVRCATNALWDGRWRVEGPHVEGHELRALGASGLQHCKAWRQTKLPRETLVTTPAIWYGETLISAPVAGFSTDWTARIVAGFKLFVLSH